MSTAPTSERTPDATKPGGRNLRWLWIGALIAVIAIGALVLWFVLSGSDEEPTLAFDGTTATYNGPESLEAGVVTFTLENTFEEKMAFAWGLINDDSLTLEDEIAWIEANPESTISPPWLATYAEIGRAGPGETVEGTTYLLEGRNDLVAHFVLDQWGHTGTRNGSTRVAAIIEVTGD